MALQITPSNMTDLEPGDMLQFQRPMYSHYGIYTGGNKVVHVAGIDGGQIGSNAQHSLSSTGMNFNKAEVVKSDLHQVGNGSKVYKNNYKDNMLRPLPKRMIVSNANSSVGKRGYNILTNNCEHHATQCRYGQGSSQQVDSVVGDVLIGLAAGAAAAIGYGIYRLFFSKNEKEKTKEGEL